MLLCPDSDCQRLRFSVLSTDFVRVTKCFYDYDYLLQSIRDCILSNWSRMEVAQWSNRIASQSRRTCNHYLLTTESLSSNYLEPTEWNSS